MEKGIQIQLATLNDIEELAQFARKAFTAAYEEEMGKDAVQNHLEIELTDDKFSTMMNMDAFYLAIYNSKLAGFAQIGSVDLSYHDYLINFDPNGVEIRRLYVLSKYQNQGIGSMLIEKSTSDPLVKQARNIYLTTWESNYGAQELYERHGFEKVGQFPEYDENGELNGYEYILAKSNRQPS
ncbi:MAG: GNAT family N-acetyltransferase [Chloroflexota bacterium]